jgi:thiol-disulfide isomerase/thioredoxin
MHTIARILILFGSLHLLMGSVTGLYAQQTTGTTDFHIAGRLQGKDTGSVVLWFTNFANDLQADTVKLNQGAFSFSGSVRRASEALLWTEDPKNRSFDDPSVVRFILVPGELRISKIAGSKQRATISGSAPEIQKEKWDDVRAVYTEEEDSLFKVAASLRKLAENQPSVNKSLNLIYGRIDSIKAIVLRLDVGYIAQHPDSYLGGYLLVKRCRKLPIDSVMLFYKALADSVKKSSVGHRVLAYLYPLTNDSQFRIENPLIDIAFTDRLMAIRSINDFQLDDQTGKPVNFQAFSGKYLLLDVWASWCGPCIKNIPAWNELQKSYDTALIQFVGVSMDKETEPWKRALSAHRPAGIQLIDTTSFSGLFSIYCKVLWVPMYIIVDPAGQIVNYDAPQPLEPELRKLLDKLINKRTVISH